MTLAALIPIGVGVLAMLIGIVLRVAGSRREGARLEAGGWIIMVSGGLFALFSLGAAML